MNTIKVGRKLTTSNEILVRTAIDNGVKIEKVPGEKARFRMIHGKKNYLIKSGFVIKAYNSRLALRLCKQKDVVSSYLRSRGFPAPENATFKKGEELRAWSWAEYILPVVLKPVDGALGNMVYVKIEKKEDFIEYFNKIANKYERVLIEQFLEGSDHRFLVVNNKVVGILNRVPACVVGDGKSTIKELVEKKNLERKHNPVLKQIKIDKSSRQILQRNGYDLNSVPAKNENVRIKDGANISNGADSYERFDEINDSIKDMVQKAIKSIPGLKICGVDVLIDGDKAYIIELNGNPMVHIHYHPTCGNKKNVGNDVIQAMFPNL